MADEINGKATHLGGKIKEKAGELLGDARMEREGELEQMKGRAEQDESRAIDAANEARARRVLAESEERRTEGL